MTNICHICGRDIKRLSMKDHLESSTHKAVVKAAQLREKGLRPIPYQLSGLVPPELQKVWKTNLYKNRSNPYRNIVKPISTGKNTLPQAEIWVDSYVEQVVANVCRYAWGPASVFQVHKLIYLLKEKPHLRKPFVATLALANSLDVINELLENAD